MNETISSELVVCEECDWSLAEIDDRDAANELMLEHFRGTGHTIVRRPGIECQSAIERRPDVEL